MAEYVVYFLRQGGGTGQATVHAMDDTEAFNRARRIDGMSTVEIWKGRRMVGRFAHPAQRYPNDLVPPDPRTTAP